ncbi:uncharacterized protein THITE_2093288 [Thermothielavioides terrestris NRRL 8126]|uniref:Uncharacterized protein n=1 Tax=Thermothielavioides terrestris (strain ATCC 38088 / NRRL 8126) TaxID=578455 RepID=G2RG38_THETT|nr:uncharacterized protein THITE_2093288 [Thermothielavioides terrestris NRRL 8126]AEO71792.1 hypothetical protein THITE_2093288 [Thermothielavioides terrestris NRRL 8126]
MRKQDARGIFDFDFLSLDTAATTRTLEAAVTPVLSLPAKAVETEVPMLEANGVHSAVVPSSAKDRGPNSLAP